MPPFLVHFLIRVGNFFWGQTRYFYYFAPPPIVRQKAKLAYGSNSCFYALLQAVHKLVKLLLLACLIKAVLTNLYIAPARYEYEA